MSRRRVFSTLVVLAALLGGAYLAATSFHKHPPSARGDLHWVRGTKRIVLDDNILIPGKLVVMEEHYRRVRAPGYFKVVECLDSVFDDAIGGSRCVAGSMFRVRARRGLALSETWQLPAPSQLRGQSTYIFRDDRRHPRQSRAIYSSRIGRVLCKYKMEFGWLVSVADSVLEINCEMIFAVDPPVSLSVVVPWGRNTRNLRPYIARYLHLVANKAPVEARAPGSPAAKKVIEARIALFRREFAAYLPQHPPPGWDFSISPSVVLASSNGRANFTLTLNVPTRGRALFAIRAIAAGQTPTSVVSEILGVVRK
jgi:hypothetical protein